MTLNELKNGQSARITAVGGTGALRQHFLDMGIIPGADVTLVKFAPLGDPMELLIQGYSLTLRLEEASNIEIIPSDKQEGTANDSEFGYILSLHDHNSHPGYGESGKFHSKKDENPLPEGSTLSFALAGQQNSGKTTLFNELTGANLHVSNFPGTTMDRKSGQIKGYDNTMVTDLPGTYSLSPYSVEENISIDFILDEKPKGIINIVDTNNIERSLYLTLQLMELGVPLVLALNMMDEVRNNGGSVRVNEMERILGVPVVPISAAKGEGIQELIDHALHVAKYQEAPESQNFFYKDEYNASVHRCLHGIMEIIEGNAEHVGLPKRFAAEKVVEGNETIISRLALTENEKDAIEHIILEMEDESGLDRNAAIAEMRYSFIRRLCSHTVVKPGESKEHKRSERLDKAFTGKFTALPMFIIIMGLVFWLTFDVIGLWLQNLMDAGISGLAGIVNGAFVSWGVAEPVRSLVVDAVFGGVGSVLSFFPIILVLFFFLSMLEDSGYMARIAFVSDKLLRRLGLSGRSIVPMLISFGCSVPGIMATRTLPSKSDRRRTIILIPFMSCSAKIAVYGFLTSAFFPGHAGIIIVGLYFLGIILGILAALVGKKLGKEKEAAPFVMELPNYRLPGAKNVAHLMWDRIKDFLQLAFTVIFVATVLIWFLQSFDLSFNFIENGEGSILAWLAGLIAPVFGPMGLADWRIVTALITGCLAKESIVSTMEVLGAAASLTTLTAIPLLVFCLLYTPCVASIATIRRELGGKWAIFTVVFQCAIAWLCAWASFLIAGLFI